MERHIEVWQGEEWLCSDAGKIVKLRDLYKAYEVELANYAQTVSNLQAQLAAREQEIAKLQDHIDQDKIDFDDLKAEHDLELEGNRVLAKELAEWKQKCQEYAAQSVLDDNELEDARERLALWRKLRDNIKNYDWEEPEYIGAILDKEVYLELKAKGEFAPQEETNAPKHGTGGR